MVGKGVTLAEQLAGSTFTVLADGYAVVRAPDQVEQDGSYLWRNCFAMIYDGGAGERTLIVKTAEVASVADPGHPVHSVYRAIRINLLVPFEGVGFIASVSGAIARKGVNLLAVSAFSYDYFLVKEEDLDKAVAALSGLGIRHENA